MSDKTPSTEEQLEQAYQDMMDRVHAGLELAGEKARPMWELIDRAADKAVELEELSREQADRIAEYLRRDLHEAGSYLHENSTEFSQWLRFDLTQLEDRMIGQFSKLMARSAFEFEAWQQLSERASTADYVWHTGEVTGPGSLACEHCGKQLNFTKSTRIPPCPACHKTAFKRVEDEEEEG